MELSRLLSNLINNAIEAHATRILIQAENVQPVTRIKISDNGKGIPNDKLKKVIEKGFSFNKKSGTGLGLSYAKEVTEKSGGQLILFSTLGEGTEIILEFMAENA
jgi:signal transduction histidine kinase